MTDTGRLAGVRGSRPVAERQLKSARMSVCLTFVMYLHCDTNGNTNSDDHWPDSSDRPAALSRFIMVGSTRKWTCEWPKDARDQGFNGRAFGLASRRSETRIIACRSLLAPSRSPLRAKTAKSFQKFVPHWEFLLAFQCWEASLRIRKVLGISGATISLRAINLYAHLTRSKRP